MLDSVNATFGIEDLDLEESLRIQQSYKVMDAPGVIENVTVDVHLSDYVTLPSMMTCYASVLGLNDARAAAEEKLKTPDAEILAGLFASDSLYCKSMN